MPVLSALQAFLFYAPVTQHSGWHHLNWLSNSDLNKQLYLMQQAGIQWTRFDFTMDIIEPSPGNFHWISYDNIVNTAATYGIKVIALIAQYKIPSWANSTIDNRVPPPPSIYQSFTQAIAAHYADNISLFELGNEPNMTTNWHPQWNAAAYTALLKAGYTGVKAGNPNAKVLSGGLANFKTTNSSHSAAFTFVQQMYANGAKGYFDYFAYHPYSQPQGPDSMQFKEIDVIKNLMDKNGDTNKKIIITEVGWPTTANLSSGGVTQTEQASYISRLYTKIMHEDYQYIPIACIYDFRNDGTDPTYDEQNFGVVNADYSPKPAYFAMKNASLDFSSHFTAVSP